MPPGFDDDLVPLSHATDVTGEGSGRVELAIVQGLYFGTLGLAVGPGGVLLTGSAAALTAWFVTGPAMTSGRAQLINASVPWGLSHAALFGLAQGLTGATLSALAAPLAGPILFGGVFSDWQPSPGQASLVNSAWMWTLVCMTAYRLDPKESLGRFAQPTLSDAVAIAVGSNSAAVFAALAGKDITISRGSVLLADLAAAVSGIVAFAVTSSAATADPSPKIIAGATAAGFAGVLLLGVDPPAAVAAAGLRLAPLLVRDGHGLSIGTTF